VLRGGTRSHTILVENANVGISCHRMIRTNAGGDKVTVAFAVTMTASIYLIRGKIILMTVSGDVNAAAAVRGSGLGIVRCERRMIARERNERWRVSMLTTLVTKRGGVR